MVKHGKKRCLKSSKRFYYNIKVTKIESWTMIKTLYSCPTAQFIIKFHTKNGFTSIISIIRALPIKFFRNNISNPMKVQLGLLKLKNSRTMKSDIFLQFNIKRTPQRENPGKNNRILQLMMQITWTSRKKTIGTWTRLL